MKGQILLVEDESCLAQLMALELAEAGYGVETRPDGCSGLHQAQAMPPDVLLLDWSLPMMNGLEICMRLRADGCTVPIIFVTSHAGDETKAAALEAGANDYMLKPFDMEELLQKIEGFMEGCLGSRLNAQTA